MHMFTRVRPPLTLPLHSDRAEPHHTLHPVTQQELATVSSAGTPTKEMHLSTVSLPQIPATTDPVITTTRLGSTAEAQPFGNESKIEELITPDTFAERDVHLRCPSCHVLLKGISAFVSHVQSARHGGLRCLECYAILPTGATQQAHTVRTDHKKFDGMPITLSTQLVSRFGPFRFHSDVTEFLLTLGFRRNAPPKTTPTETELVASVLFLLESLEASQFIPIHEVNQLACNFWGTDFETTLVATSLCNLKQWMMINRDLFELQDVPYDQDRCLCVRLQPSWMPRTQAARERVLKSVPLPSKLPPPQHKASTTTRSRKTDRRRSRRTKRIHVPLDF